MDSRKLTRVVTNKAPLDAKSHKKIAQDLANEIAADFMLPSGYNIGIIEYEVGIPPKRHLLIALSSESMNAGHPSYTVKMKELQTIINGMNRGKISIRLANDPQATAKRHGHGGTRQYPGIVEEQHKGNTYLIDKNSQPIKLYYINTLLEKSEIKLDKPKQDKLQELTKTYHRNRNSTEQASLRDFLSSIKCNITAVTTIDEREPVGTNTYLIDKTNPKSVRLFYIGNKKAGEMEVGSLSQTEEFSSEVNKQIWHKRTKEEKEQIYQLVRESAEYKADPIPYHCSEPRLAAEREKLILLNDNYTDLGESHFGAMLRGESWVAEERSSCHECCCRYQYKDKDFEKSPGSAAESPMRGVERETDTTSLETELKSITKKLKTQYDKYQKSDEKNQEVKRQLFNDASELWAQAKRVSFNFDRDLTASGLNIMLLKQLQINWYVIQGAKYSKRGRYEEAAICYNAALIQAGLNEDFPQDAMADLYLARAVSLAAQEVPQFYRQPMKDLREAFRLNPIILDTIDDNKEENIDHLVKNVIRGKSLDEKQHGQLTSGILEFQNCLLRQKIDIDQYLPDINQVTSFLNSRYVFTLEQNDKKLETGVIALKLEGDNIHYKIKDKTGQVIPKTIPLKEIPGKINPSENILKHKSRILKSIKGKDPSIPDYSLEQKLVIVNDMLDKQKRIKVAPKQTDRHNANIAALKALRRELLKNISTASFIPDTPAPGVPQEKLTDDPYSKELEVIRSELIHLNEDSKNVNLDKRDDFDVLYQQAYLLIQDFYQPRHQKTAMSLLEQMKPTNKHQILLGAWVGAMAEKQETLLEQKQGQHLGLQPPSRPKVSPQKLAQAPIPETEAKLQQIKTELEILATQELGNLRGLKDKLRQLADLSTPTHDEDRRNFLTALIEQVKTLDPDKHAAVNKRLKQLGKCKDLIDDQIRKRDKKDDDDAKDGPGPKNKDTEGQRGEQALQRPGPALETNKNGNADQAQEQQGKKKNTLLTNIEGLEGQPGKKYPDQKAAGNHKVGAILPGEKSIVFEEKDQRFLSRLPGFSVDVEGIGYAKDDGNCFFHTIQKLLFETGQENHSIESLRKICRDAALESKNEKAFITSFSEDKAVQDSVRKELNGDGGYAQYLRRICLSAEDAAGQIPIWGRPLIEGRLICHALNIQLHVVEIAVAQPEGQRTIIVTHELIDKNGRKEISPQDANLVPLHMVLMQDITKKEGAGLHFVPYWTAEQRLQLMQHRELAQSPYPFILKATHGPIAPSYPAGVLPKRRKEKVYGEPSPWHPVSPTKEAALTPGAQADPLSTKALTAETESSSASLAPKKGRG